jgi:hypothetical protein
VLESMEGMKCPAVKCLRVLSWTSFSSSGRARCNSIFLHLPNHGEQAAAMVGCMGLLVLSWEAICCSRTEKGKGQPAVVGGETAEAEVAPSRRAAGERTAGRGRGWGACYRRFSEIGEVEADLAGWRLDFAGDVVGGWRLKTNCCPWSADRTAQVGRFKEG